jgi:hypothetical protein
MRPLIVAVLVVAGGAAARAEPITLAPDGVGAVGEVGGAGATKLAVGGGYQDVGFNLTPAMVAHLTASHDVGAWRVLTDVGVSSGVYDGERAGDASVGVLRAIAPGLRAGVLARLRVDLERDDDEPIGEPDWELDGGACAQWTRGALVVDATAGAGAQQLRLVDTTRAGAVGMLRVGATF